MARETSPLEEAARAKAAASKANSTRSHTARLVSGNVSELARKRPPKQSTFNKTKGGVKEAGKSEDELTPEAKQRREAENEISSTWRTGRRGVESGPMALPSTAVTRPTDTPGVGKISAEHKRLAAKTDEHTRAFLDMSARLNTGSIRAADTTKKRYDAGMAREDARRKAHAAVGNGPIPSTLELPCSTPSCTRTNSGARSCGEAGGTCNIVGATGVNITPREPMSTQKFKI